MEAPASLAGRILLALPGMGDPRFERAVIAMCAHDENGALGIGVGHVVPGLGLHDVMEQLEVDPGGAPNVPVHFGGPVEPQRGFILHSPDWSDGDTLRVGAVWALSANLDVLKAIAAGSGPSRWLLAFGYAGWGGGQLDGEMTRHGWFAIPGRDDLVFDQSAEERWTASYESAGIDPRLIVPDAGHA